MIRLVPDHSGSIQRAPFVEFTFNGRAISGHMGETVFTALTRAGVLYLRNAPQDGAPRGAFCCMGLCQECVVDVAGVSVESCRQLVSDGLVVLSVTRDKDG
uniref:(2Fe-2S)-binding protein n=1 Tax=Pararhizobium sp. IMCC3301 TaxID=3067904 RepID=UPI0027425A56|nr:(2Fe-2S)-binding protein [Pararhizobium sp. IMCC3301]